MEILEEVTVEDNTKNLEHFIRPHLTAFALR